MAPFIPALLTFLVAAQEPDTLQKERATLLRTALKPFAAFQGVDSEGRLALRLEGDGGEKTWAVDPDAEIRVRGYWGGLEDLVRGERIWVWARVDRENKPRAVFMIADEMSEQDIHQVPYTIASVDRTQRTVVIRRKLDGKTEQSRTLKVPATLEMPEEGERPVYVQTAGDDLVRLATAESLAKLKEEQKSRLEERWRKTGLPGTVTAIHWLSGEIEITLDHAALRWGRSLKPNDRVTLNLEKPLKVMVQEVRPWYERTRLALVSSGRDLADVPAGRRIRVSMTEPAAEVRESRLPSDADRPREAAARAEWILASTYCSCAIKGDVCTGMFYTLAACNTMTCGMPNRVRGFVRPLIEKGMTDKELFEKMEGEFGPAIWKPHLLK